MGSIVRPIFDRFKLARIRLAYLLNATSSSQCLLVPLSSWAAVIIMQLKAAGISCSTTDNPLVLSDAYTLYFAAIPCMLYPMASIFSTWVFSALPYGPIIQQEKAQLATTETMPHVSASSSLSNLIVPLGTFLLMIPYALMLNAGWRPFFGTVAWCDAIKQVDGILIALFWAGVTACTFSAIFFKITGQLTWNRIASLSYDGFTFMRNSLLLLLFSWTLTSLLKDLQTSTYLAQIIMTKAPLSIIPAACFLTATFITAAIGSSWGMMSIMITLVVPLVVALTNLPLPGTPEQFALLLPTLGALFSGAAAGPQLSPITDAAIISSATAGITPIEHIRTMIPYAVAPLAASILGFLALPFLPNTLYFHLLVLVGTLIATLTLHIARASYMQRQLK